MGQSGYEVCEVRIGRPFSQKNNNTTWDETNRFDKMQSTQWYSSIDPIDWYLWCDSPSFCQSLLSFSNFPLFSLLLQFPPNCQSHSPLTRSLVHAIEPFGQSTSLYYHIRFMLLYYLRELESRFLFNLLTISSPQLSFESHRY